MKNKLIKHLSTIKLLLDIYYSLANDSLSNNNFNQTEKLLDIYKNILQIEIEAIELLRKHK